MPQDVDSNQLPAEQVSTEPQRKALEAMSQELLDKLNKMVEEQQQRAQEFAAHQHSLSSLPSAITPPPIQEYTAPAASQWEKPMQYAPQDKLPPIPNRVRPQAPHYTYAEPVEPSPAPRHIPRPKPVNKTKDDTENTDATIGAGAIIFILAVIFIILSRGCS